MPALKSYGDFYDGSAARKIEPKETVQRKTKKLESNRKYGKIVCVFTKLFGIATGQWALVDKCIRMRCIKN